GYRVRVVARSPERLEGVPWAGSVDVVVGDLADAACTARACEGVDVLYYLVHSMGGRGDFEAREHAIAQTVADAAADAGVGRIVYLGGLHPSGGRLSRHLRSRVDVGRVLLASG
ncbi:NAD(P)H-binding protein, partial [Rhizobium johnstonii]|uniref:NAD(P)H-binding protein n=1 Tax=Rhizobium johnstonii TaxID=3019933 RepID=UPI003F9A8B6E